MKNLLLFWLALAFGSTAAGQSRYWQQQLEYTLDVALNDKEHSLEAFLKLKYENHSPDTLRFIWFHLWPNAFKNDQTAFSEQLLENGRTDFYFSSREQRGYINRLDFRVENIACKTEDHPLYIDVVKVVLPEPLLPGQTTTLTTPFHVQLPANFSRGGHTGQSYQITQWYPKPAVYDQLGWHPMPYVDQGEFYSEWASYNVQITVPENYVVAAPGLLANPAEKGWLQQRARFSLPKPFTKPSPPSSKTPSAVIPSSSQTKTLLYTLDRAHDFAWFADKSYIVNQDTVQLPSGKTIELWSYYWPGSRSLWEKSISYMKDAVRFRSAQIGEYPYTSLSAVEAKMGFPGGMEYPTITALSSIKDAKSLDLTLQHEIGHNWFYGVLASNEREHPWMDEGINTFYDLRYEEEKYPAVKSKGKPHQHDLLSPYIVRVQRQEKLHLAQPITTSAVAFTPDNYWLIAYYKTALWLRQLEKQIGKSMFDSSLRSYFQHWQFKHPQPEDFFQEVEQVSGRNLGDFRRAAGESTLQHDKQVAPQRKNNSLSGDPSTSAPQKFHLAPVPGYNLYDGLMLGAALHNFNFIPAKVQVLAAAQYGFQSKRISGLAYLSYVHYPAKGLEKWEISLTASRYSTLSGKDSNGLKIHGQYFQFTPAFTLYFPRSQPRQTLTQWLEWKTYLIGEQGFAFTRKTSDSLYYPKLSTVQHRYLNQLTFVRSNSRALYPYEGSIQLQQAKDFYRINLTATYFMNYATKGGLSIRFFAAKFGYLGKVTLQQKFATQRYQPKLTAVRGAEDYTYGNYFVGRNETSGWASQQMMIRDGALKLRTDLFQDLQGRSDQWIAAANFSSTLPPALLPPAVPLRLFLDVGTYADSWSRNSKAQKFLFVGGLQLSLFKNVLNIYAPLVYSKIFVDNLKSVPDQHTFLKKLSFSIDLERMTSKKTLGIPFNF